MYYERLARSKKRFEASNSGKCLKNLMESSPPEHQHDKMENHLNFNRRCIESFMVVFAIPIASKIWDIYLIHVWYRIVICP